MIFPAFKKLALQNKVGPQIAIPKAAFKKKRSDDGFP
jgi:hypothetical protein